MKRNRIPKADGPGGTNMWIRVYQLANHLELRLFTTMYPLPTEDNPERKWGGAIFRENKHFLELEDYLLNKGLLESVAYRKSFIGSKQPFLEVRENKIAGNSALSETLDK